MLWRTWYLDSGLILSIFSATVMKEIWPWLIKVTCKGILCKFAGTNHSPLLFLSLIYSLKVLHFSFQTINCLIYKPWGVHEVCKWLTFMEKINKIISLILIIIIKLNDFYDNQATACQILLSNSPDLLSWRKKVLSSTWLLC